MVATLLAQMHRRAFSEKRLRKALTDADPLMGVIPDVPRWDLDKPGVWRTYVERGSRRLRVRVFKERGAWTWNVDRINGRGHVSRMAVGVGRTRRLARTTGYNVAKLYSTGVASW